MDKYYFLLFWTSDPKYEEVIIPIMDKLSNSPYRDYFSLINCLKDPVTRKFPKARKLFNVSMVPTIIDLKNGNKKYYEGILECNLFIDELNSHSNEQLRDTLTNYIEVDLDTKPSLIDFTVFNPDDWLEPRKRLTEKDKKDIVFGYENKHPNEKIDKKEAQTEAEKLAARIKTKKSNIVRK